MAGATKENYTSDIGVEQEAKIVLQCNLGDEKQDIILIEDFIFKGEFFTTKYGGNSWRHKEKEYKLEKGTMISTYGISNYKYFKPHTIGRIELRLLKAHNKGNDSDLIGEHFSFDIMGLNGMKYKKVKRDSHLLALTRKRKIEALFGNIEED